LYATTLVLQNHATQPETAGTLIAEAQVFYKDRLPWVNSFVVKTRGQRKGRRSQANNVVTSGNAPAHKIQEHGVWYALDLLHHQDATFYLDTRNLRRWAIDHLAELRVLNTFAYTGSLGVAALAGGAQQVIQLDRNQNFLNLAKNSYALNGFAIRREEFIIDDFFPAINTLKRNRSQFDCVFLDPPFFSVTRKGRIDLVPQSGRVINKVRPLISDGGCLVSVNNALFLSGDEYIMMLETLCADGYLSIEELIPIPSDCAGFPATQVRLLPTDPTPFNHATKIAILRVRRKRSIS
jgi:23S rRNA (cytosine1962-C5)-methyltransferase